MPGQPRPLTFEVVRDVAIDEPGNYSDKAIPKGTILYRYAGNPFGNVPLSTGVFVSESGPTELPYFEMPLSVLKVHEYQPGKTEVMYQLTDDPDYTKLADTLPLEIPPDGGVVQGDS